MFPGEASAPGNIYCVTHTKGGRVGGVSVPANWYPGGKGVGVGRSWVSEEGRHGETEGWRSNDRDFKTRFYCFH